MMAGKIGFLIFSSTNSFSTYFFNLKHPRNFIKPINYLQKHKNKTTSKTKIKLKQKIFSNSDMFFRYFQGKKKTHTPNLN